jgi:hypothetical protein
MTLADRCDEIVRLIDETLTAVAADSDSALTATVRPSEADLVGGHSRPLRVVQRRRPDRVLS